MKNFKCRIWDIEEERLIGWDEKEAYPWFMGAIENNEYNDRIVIELLTGLKDKNGVDIYEGDIVLPEYNNLGEIEVEYYKGFFNIARYAIDNLRVVGNIHQNKNLIK